MPEDLAAALAADRAASTLWQGLTPLGRNEFICWVEDAKKPETRRRRIARTREELHEGKRRPCCWPGCIHRPDKPPGKWQQAVRAGGRRGEADTGQESTSAWGVAGDLPKRIKQV